MSYEQADHYEQIERWRETDPETDELALALKEAFELPDRAARCNQLCKILMGNLRGEG